MQHHDEDFLANTKKLLVDMTDTAHHVKELAASINTNFQPLVEPVQSSPPSVIAPTSSSVTAMDAATLSVDATLTAKSLVRCLMVCPDRDTSVHTSALALATTQVRSAIINLDNILSRIVIAQPVINTFTADTILAMPTKFFTEDEVHAINIERNAATTCFISKMPTKRSTPGSQCCMSDVQVQAMSPLLMATSLLDLVSTWSLSASLLRSFIANKLNNMVPTNYSMIGPHWDASDIGVTNLAIVLPAGLEAISFGFAIDDDRAFVLNTLYLRSCSYGCHHTVQSVTSIVVLGAN